MQLVGWVKTATLASKTKKYYANGWRLLSRTKLVSMRLDHITKDDIDVLTFHVPAPSVNCALRTLRRMLHKAEEWNLLQLFLTALNALQEAIRVAYFLLVTS